MYLYNMSSSINFWNFKYGTNVAGSFAWDGSLKEMGKRSTSQQISLQLYIRTFTAASQVK